MTLTQLRELIDNCMADVTGQKRTPSKSAPVLTAKEYNKKGQEHYHKLVTVCEKNDFDGAALDAVMYDSASMELFQALASGDTASEAHKKGFENLKDYLRGAKSVLQTYKSPRKNPQDAVIKYSLNSIDMALSSPDYATYMARQVKLGEIIQQKMKAMTWEVLADVDFSAL